MLKYKIIFNDNHREFPVEGTMEICREEPGCEILVRGQGKVIRTGIQDGNVSRLGFHVSLRPEPDRLVIQDLGSSWGTYLDGEPLGRLEPEMPQSANPRGLQLPLENRRHDPAGPLRAGSRRMDPTS